MLYRDRFKSISNITSTEFYSEIKEDAMSTTVAGIFMEKF